MLMRITFVLAEADLSGGCRVISIYAQRLQSMGHKVTVVSRPPRKPSLRDRLRHWVKGKPIPGNRKVWPSYFDDIGVQHHKIESHRPVVASDVPDADVVIATWWETAEWVSHFPPSKGAKAYFLQHLETHLGMDAARVEATWRLPFHKIVIAEWLAKVSRERFGDGNYSLVPNSVDFGQFSAPVRAKQPVPTVGLMYSLIPFKGVDISLKAVELARQQMPELKLVTFGNRPSGPPLLLPAGTQHTVQPAQDRIKDIYSACDVWLVASRSEGFGLPILEAMACRTPVIATPTGAAPELLAPGGGAIVPLDDAPAMAAAIVRILRLSDAAWRGLSDQAYQTATSYSWDDATGRFLQALTRSIEKSQARSGEQAVARPDKA